MSGPVNSSGIAPSQCNPRYASDARPQVTSQTSTDLKHPGAIDMEFGFGVAMRGSKAAREFLERQVKHGESLGFDIVTVSDHVIIPKEVQSIYPYSEDGAFSGVDAGECLEQLTVAMFLAAHTSNIKVMTSVMVLPHRPAVLAAKILASLDVLSGGRLIIGVGAGWMQEEFEALDTAPYEHRGSVANDYIRAFKEMWTSDEPEYNGTYAHVSGMSFYPKPVQDPHPPIWVGGESPPALRRAGQLGNAWYPIGSNPAFPMDTPERLAEGMATVRRHAEEAGRDPASIDFGYSAGWYDDRGEKPGRDGDRMVFTGTSDQVVADIREFETLGVRHLIVGLDGTTPEETLDRMERFATEVMPYAS